MFVQVLPLSEDFKIPIPAYDDLEELFSPVPTTINLVFQSTSKSPNFAFLKLKLPKPKWQVEKFAFSPIKLQKEKPE